MEDGLRRQESLRRLPHPRRPQRGFQYVAWNLGQKHPRRPHFSPASGDGGENLGCVLYHSSLLFRREQQYAISFRLKREGGEDSSSDPEVDGPEMRALHGLGQGQSNAAKFRGRSCELHLNSGNDYYLHRRCYKGPMRQQLVEDLITNRGLLDRCNQQSTTQRNFFDASYSKFSSKEPRSGLTGFAWLSTINWFMSAFCLTRCQCCICCCMRVSTGARGLLT